MSVLLKTKSARRGVLRAAFNGGAVAVALPFLDCFLNDSGTALAATGAPLPVRFGTWFWGLGHSLGHGFSDNTQRIELLTETKALEPLLPHMNAFTGFNSPLDGKSNYVHYSGWVAARTGTSAISTEEIPAPTLDVLVADAIGNNTRFRSLDLAASGGARASYSARNSGLRNAAEGSPLALYMRLFGPGFTDPNSAEFTPNTDALLRRSVLSTIIDDSRRLAPKLGASDKARIDEYFTSIRELEQQLALQLEKPSANEACKIPPVPAEVRPSEERGSLIETTIPNHRALIQLLTMALACNQTRVFTMTFSLALSNLRRSGSADTHHTLSHDEPIDPELGFQPNVSWFNCRSMEACTEFVQAFAAVREGSGTLLDNTLILAHSDTCDAKLHAIDSIPVMTFGRAGGRVKTGMRFIGNGDPITRIGLTAMQVVGVPIQSWGTKSLSTSKVVSEVLA